MARTVALLLMIVGAILGLGRAQAADANLTDPGILAAMQAWYRADLGTTNIGSHGGTWADQSGHGYTATVTSSAGPSVLADAALNNQAVLSFTGSQVLTLPNVMSTLTAGELLAVIKSNATANANNGWMFFSGSASGSTYPDSTGAIEDTFCGFLETVPHPTVPLTSYNVFDVSVAAHGQWTLRLNEQLQRQVAYGAASIPWSSAPLLGEGDLSNGTGVYFTGNIAEVFVFKQLLTQDQLVTLGHYFNTRYQLAVPVATPGNLAANALSPTQVELNWTYAGSDAVQFEVERGLNGTWTELGSWSPNESFIDATAAAGTTYQYQVAAVTAGGISPWSAPASVTTPAAATAFSSLLGWYRADLGTQSLTGAGGQWIDQSGHGNHAILTTTAPPTIQPDALIGGRPTMQFTGSQYLTLPSLMGTSTAAEMLGIVKSNASAGTNNGWMLFTSNNFGSTYPDATGAIEDVFSGFIETVPAPTVKLTSYALFDVSVGAHGQWSLRLNDQLQRQVAYTGASISWSGSPTLGRGELSNASPVNFIGDLAEVMVFNTVLTQDQIAGMSQYLNARYQFVPLPAATPANLVASALSPTQVELNWTYAGSDAVQFEVERGLNGSWTELGSWSPSTSFEDATAVAGTTYQYQVAAVTVGGLSPWSTPATVTTPAAATAFSSLLGWYRADLGTQSLTGAGGQWIDQSGHGNHAILTTTAPPTIQPDALIGGRPTMQFTGSQYLTLPSLMGTSTAAEMLAIVKSNASAGTNNGWMLFTSNNFGSTYPDATGAIEDVFSGFIETVPAPTVKLTSYALFDVSVGAHGQWSLRLNDQLQRQVAYTGASISWSGSPTLGRGELSNASPVNFIGDLAEVMVFNTLLTQDQVAGMSQYLNVRYQFVPLPAATPANLVASALSPTQVELNWTYAGSDAVQFEVERGLNGTWTELGSWSPSTSFEDATAVAGTTYQYQVAAVTVGGLSPWSTPATVTTPAAATAFSSLLGWYRADLGTQSLTGLGGQWIDQSGHGNHAILTTVAPPTIQPDSLIGGRPTMQFTGSQYLTLPSLMGTSTAAEMLAIVKSNASAGTNNGWMLFTSNNFGSTYPDATGAIEDVFSGFIETVPAPTVKLTSYALFDVSVGAHGQWSLRLNDRLQRQVAYTGASISWSGNPTLGRGELSNASPVNFIGDLAEVMVFNTLLTQDQVAGMSQYLNARYQFVPLPAATPANLVASALSPTQVELNWTYAGSDAVQFEVERGLNGTWTELGSWSPSTSFEDATAVAGTTYQYQVAAVTVGGLSPWSAPATVTTPSAATGFSSLIGWYRADMGTLSLTGLGGQWLDQSGHANHANLITSAVPAIQGEPLLAGHPVLAFNATQVLQMPANVMGMSAAAELLVIAKSNAAANANNGWLWFTTTYGELYPDSTGAIEDAFCGISEITAKPAVPLSNYHVFDVSAAAGGLWTERLDDQVLRQVAGTPAAIPWRTNPLIGQSAASNGAAYNFTGDIAEIMVFNTVLSPDQLAGVGRYLDDRYGFIPAPATAPANLVATALSPTEVDLSWSYSAADAVQFEIQREALGGSWSTIGTWAPRTAFVDTTAAASTSYLYQVAAVTVGGLSAWSAPASVTTPSAATPFSNLIAWYRADVGSQALTGPGGVWIDQSGHGNNATVITGTSVAVQSDPLLGNHPTLQFSGGQILQMPANVMGSATAAEMLVLARSTAAANANNGWLSFSTAYGSLFPDPSGAIEDTFGGLSVASKPTAALTNYTLYDVSAANSGFYTLRLNDQMQRQVALSATSISWRTNPLIGQGSGTNGQAYDFTGDIAEILLFNAVLSQDQVASVGEYLNGRYQLFVAPAAAPANLVATALSPTEVDLAWTYSAADAVQFEVQRSLNGVWSTLGSWTPNTAWVDCTAAPGTTYQYQVAAVTVAGLSPWSAPASVTTPSAATGFSNLIGWYRADVGTQSMTGTNGLWQDQSGHGNHAVVSSSSAPTVQPEPLLSGHPVVQFNGSQYLSLPSGMMGSDTAAEMLVIVKSMPTAGVQNGWMWFGNGNGAAYPDASGEICDTLAGGSLVVAQPSVPLTSYTLYDASVSYPGTWTIRLNHQLQRQIVQSASPSWRQPLIGFSNAINGGVYPSVYFKGDIAEMMVFSTALTQDQVQSIGAYLDARYNHFIPPPAATPASLTANALSPTQVELNWTYPGADAVQFVIQRAVNGVWSEIGSWAPSTSFIDSTAVAGTSYQYEVAAVTVAGPTAWSQPATVTTPTANTAFSSLVGWYRADIGTQSLTGVGGRWMDQSGHNNHAVQATAASTSTVQVGDLGGHTVERFNGSQFLQLPNLMNSAPAGEMMVVTKVANAPDTPNGWMYFLSQGAAYPDATGSILDGFNNALVTVTAPTVPLYSYHLYDASVASPGAWTLKLNGLTQASSAIPSGGMNWVSAPLIGQSGAPGGVTPYRFTGDIAEVLVFNAALTPAQVQSVYAYLGVRYAVPNSLTVQMVAANAIGLGWEGIMSGQVQVQRRADETEPWVTVATVANVNSYADFTVDPSSTYQYQLLFPTSAPGTFTLSNQVSVATPGDVPPTASVTPDIGGPYVVEGLQPVTVSASGTQVVGGTAAGFATTDSHVPGDEFISVAGGSGAFDIDDTVQFANDHRFYLVLAVGTDAQGRTALCIQPTLTTAFSGLQVVTPAGTPLSLVDHVNTYLWEWNPAGQGYLPWGSSQSITRVMRGTDSDPWAYSGGVFTDTWGRPDGSYPIRLTVYDANGQPHQAVSSVTVMTGSGPVAKAGGPYTCSVGGVPAFLDASGSSDDHGVIDAWWDIDTAVDSTGTGDATNNHDIYGLTGAAYYTTPGDRTARVHIYDGRGHVATADAIVHVLPSCAPVVACIPFEGVPNQPHPALSGAATNLRACCWGTAPVQYKWSYGDQTQDAAWSQAATPWAISASHTYTGAIGATFTATVTVQDATGLTATATTPIMLNANMVETNTHIAVESGLWWLHQQQNRTTTPGLWGNQPNYGVAYNASCLQAFCLHGHRPFGNPLTDPYAETVRRGFRWTWTMVQPSAFYAANYQTGAFTLGHSMNDANGEGLDITSGDHAPYQLGILLDAIAAAEDPLGYSEGGPAGVNGRRFIDLARDAVDMYAFGQGNQGGWRYVWNNDADNSACQWAAIGCLAAQNNFGIYAPNWVNTLNQSWLAYSYDGNGTYGYTFSQPIYDAGAITTPSGLIQLAWDGVPTSDARWNQAFQHIVSAFWESGYYKPTVSFNDSYATYDFVKAMRLAQPFPVTVINGGLDWYNDPNDGMQVRLQRVQLSDGHWNDNVHVQGFPEMVTAWHIIMLSPALFTQQPTAIGLTPPVIAAQSLTVPTDPGKPYATVTAAQLATNSYDPSGLTYTVRLQPSGPYGVGTNQVTVIATDSSGLSAAQTVAVTVVDREAPKVTAPAAITISTDPGKATASANHLVPPSATDNVGVVSLTTNAPAQLPLGTTAVTWTARDAAGNIGTALEQVTVVDTEKPVIVAPPSVVYWAGTATSVPASAIRIGTATASDNVGVVSLTSNAPATYLLGATTVTWTARDAAGNQANATQTVDVRPGQASPSVQITSPGAGIAFLASNAINLTAEVDYANPADVVQVQFFIDGALVGSSAAAPYSCTWQQPPPGTHAVTAQATFTHATGAPVPASATSPARTFQVVTSQQVSAVQP